MLLAGRQIVFGVRLKGQRVGLHLQVTMEDFVAQLFLAREGDLPTPIGGLPFKLDVLKQKLGLQPGDYVGPYPPKWESPNKNLEGFREATYVVVRIEPSEVKDNPDFRPGYYFIHPISAQEARTRLCI